MLRSLCFARSLREEKRGEVRVQERLGTRARAAAADVYVCCMYNICMFFARFVYLFERERAAGSRILPVQLALYRE